MDPESTGSGAIRAGWTPVGGVTKRQRSTPTCQSGMQLFQVVAEVGTTCHRGHGKGCFWGMPEVLILGMLVVLRPPPPPDTWNPGFFDAVLSSSCSPWKGLVPLQ